MVIDSMVIVSSGGTPLLSGLATASRSATASSPAVTFPNKLYCGGNAAPLAPVMMKNWLPFVFGPLFAMAIEPSSYSPPRGSSSANR